MNRNDRALGTGTEDILVPSACSLCYGLCSILVRKVNGTVVRIQGNPESPVGRGKACVKGLAGVMTVYDPNRVQVPLRRTNPEKGLRIDPGWKEISWDEALDEIAERLKKIRREDPRKLFMQFTTTCSDVRRSSLPFISAFGTPNVWVSGGGLHCGNGAHLFGGLMHASWSLVPDFDLCNYAIYFGVSKGHGAGHVATTTIRQAADARSRGMKLVVVDPFCNTQSAKAAEWVPIRVGTDAALALSMVNILLNELGIYDKEYLKTRTNGPYLIKPDGHYLRDQENGKPLLWDLSSSSAKSYDDPGLRDIALEGEYQVRGTACRPAFSLLKEHVKKYSPEMASEITTIPPTTIRRLASEFGQAAQVGSKIVLDGIELPYRPAAAIFFRGAQGHVNCAFNCMSISLLNQIVGAADVPGGALGFNPACSGYPETGALSYWPKAGPDGLMVTGIWRLPHLPYPPSKPTAPQRMCLNDLFPLAASTSFAMASADQEELWQKVGLPYRPEMMINFGANSVMSVGNAETVAETLKRIPFIVSLDLFLNEFTNFADIVLPDTCYLERLDPAPYDQFIFNHPAGRGEWGWAIRQPVAEHKPGQRGFIEVLLELVERTGTREPFNIACNLLFDLKEPYNLDPKERHSWEDICDRFLKRRFGPDQGLKWFKEHGVLKWPKQVKEVYWRPFTNVRVPIYLEFFKTVGEQLKELADGYGIKLDYSFYEALPDWKPCPSHLTDSSEHDLYAFYYRDKMHTNSFTMENAWLDEVSMMNPYSYKIVIHTQAGKAKGIKDGDAIWVESARGRKVKGKAKLSEAIHPEGVAIAACAGHWSDGMPTAKGKGVFFNELLEVDLDHVDPVTLNLDLCVKVKVYKDTGRR